MFVMNTGGVKEIYRTFQAPERAWAIVQCDGWITRFAAGVVHIAASIESFDAAVH